MCLFLTACNCFGHQDSHSSPTCRHARRSAADPLPVARTAALCCCCRSCCASCPQGIRAAWRCSSSLRQCCLRSSSPPARQAAVAALAPGQRSTVARRQRWTPRQSSRRSPGEAKRGGPLYWLALQKLPGQCRQNLCGLPPSTLHLHFALKSACPPLPPPVLPPQVHRAQGSCDRGHQWRRAGAPRRLHDRCVAIGGGCDRLTECLPLAHCLPLLLAVSAVGCEQ